MPAFSYRIAIKGRDKEEDEAVAYYYTHHKVDKETKFLVHAEDVAVERQNGQLGEHDAPEVDHVTNKETIFPAISNVDEL